MVFQGVMKEAMSIDDTINIHPCQRPNSYDVSQ
jgi:hypothetical protein